MLIACMFCNNKSNKTCILQNNTFYKIQSIKFITTFKPEHSGKVKTHISCVSTKLQMNYKRRVSKTLLKYFCKYSFSDFWNERNLEIYPFVRMFFHVCLRAFAYTLRRRVQEVCTPFFKLWMDIIRFFRACPNLC